MIRSIILLVTMTMVERLFYEFYEEDTKLMAVTLSFLNRFSKSFH